MSDSRSAGYYRDQSAKVAQQKCPSGETHKWVQQGTWPSSWYVCAHCNEKRFDK